MHATELLFLGLNSRVIALNKRDGQVVWAAELTGILGDNFVTVQADGQSVFAFTKGRIYCLDLRSGRILWTNELKGYGYGIATICLPGFGSAPDAAALAKHHADESAESSAG